MIFFRTPELVKNSMSDFDRIVDTLRQHGERITIQRRFVIEALLDTRDHMTISDINTHIQHMQNVPPLAEPTIYRILQWLKELEIVSQTDIAESGVVYQIIGEQKHHHLACLTCGKIINLDDALFDDIREQVKTQYNFQPRIDHMVIYGYCEDCSPDETDNPTD